MHKIFFTRSLLHASTYFEHHVLIVRRSELYYTAAGIITLCRWPSGAQVERVLAQPVHRTATYRCDDTKGCIVQF
jgi:hypothetical protein